MQMKTLSSEPGKTTGRTGQEAEELSSSDGEEDIKDRID